MSIAAKKDLSYANKISWFEPRWAHAPRLLSQLDRIVGIKPLTRISLGSLAFGMVLVLGLKLAMPQIVLPPIWQMILILPGGVLYALVIVVVLILIPRRIVVSRDRIVIEHSKKRLLECSSIKTSWLLVHGTNKVRLKLG